MWNQPSKHLLLAAAVLGLGVPVWMAGQDKPAARGGTAI